MKKSKQAKPASFEELHAAELATLDEAMDSASKLLEILLVSLELERDFEIVVRAKRVRNFHAEKKAVKEMLDERDRKRGHKVIS